MVYRKEMKTKGKEMVHPLFMVQAFFFHFFKQEISDTEDSWEINTCK